MTREQLKLEVRDMMMSLTDASIQFEMHGLGGCKDFSFKNFPKKHHEMIKRYVTNKTEEYSSDIVVDFIIDNFENRSCESCKECIYLGVDTDICLKCSHSYASKFKRINNEL